MHSTNERRHENGERKLRKNGNNNMTKIFNKKDRRGDQIIKSSHIKKKRNESWWVLVSFVLILLNLVGCNLAPSETTLVTKITDSNNSTSGSWPIPSTYNPGTTVLNTTSANTTSANTTSVNTTSVYTTNPSTALPITNPEEAIYQVIEKLTLEEKVKQMLVVHFDETTGEAANAGEYGGYLFFADFFKDRQPADVKRLLKQISEKSNTPYPLLLAVDEEGGTVNRISGFTQYRSQKFKAPQKIVNDEGIPGLIQDTKEKAQFLKELGINLNLAPVADVSTNPNSFIYSRTLGVSIDETSLAIAAMIKTMKEANILSCLKHFPGYNDNVDTHEAVAVDGSSITELTKRLKPFQAGIRAGASTLMVSHIVIKAFDEKLPASLSAKAHEFIRRELGFQGVIITDDLQMKGLTKITDDPFAMAVTSGNDLLITDDPTTALESIVQAVKDKTIDESQIDAALVRLFKLKATLNGD